MLLKLGIVILACGVNGSYKPTQMGISMPSDGTNPKADCYRIYQGPQQPGICAPFAQPTVMAALVPQKSPLNVNPDLVRLLQLNPGIAEKLASFLEYKGITQPWPEIFDFNSDKRPNMPAPDPMFTKIQSLVNVLEDVRELLSNELFKVETYISGGRWRLVEEVNNIRRYLNILRSYFKRVASARTIQTRNTYAAKFAEFSKKTYDEIKIYEEIKKWLRSITTLFRTLIPC